MNVQSVTFRQLERAGRLGNQLFQVAATVGIARAIGARPCLPPRWSYRPYLNVPDEWFRPARGRAIEAWAWEGLEYMDERARLYLQDPALFRDVADEIRSAFQPKEAPAVEHLGWNRRWGDGIALHVRRGDLLTQEQGFQPALTEDAPGYYRSALDAIDPMDVMPVVVFSDCANWCRDYMRVVAGRPVEVWFGKPRSHKPSEYRRQMPEDWVDLILMSQFDHLVMSNSTFAWWAAWLNPDRDVLYPDLWWGPRLSHLDHHVMIPPEFGWREVPCD